MLIVSTRYSANSAPNVIVDCIAWKRTNLLSFSTMRNTIPVMGPSR